MTFLATMIVVLTILPQPAEPAPKPLGNAVKYIQCGRPTGIYPILEVVFNQRMTFTFQTNHSVIEIWLNPENGTSTVTETSLDYEISCIISTGNQLNFSDVPDSIFLKDKWIPYEKIFKQQKG